MKSVGMLFEVVDRYKGHGCGIFGGRAEAPRIPTAPSDPLPLLLALFYTISYLPFLHRSSTVGKGKPGVPFHHLYAASRNRDVLGAFLSLGNSGVKGTFGTTSLGWWSSGERNCEGTEGICEGEERRSTTDVPLPFLPQMYLWMGRAPNFPCL